MLKNNFKTLKHYYKTNIQKKFKDTIQKQLK